MLFGAGICLMTDRAQARGARVAVLHYRRMTALLLIGLVHAYLFWYGDILVTYALCGLVLYPLRRLRSVWLIVVALVMIAIGMLLSLGAGLTADEWPAAARESLLADFAPSAESIAEEVTIHRNGGLPLIRHLVSESLAMQTTIFLFWSFWRDTGVMLLGMAFYKLGLLSGLRSRGLYLVLAVCGLAAGLALVLTGLQRKAATGWEVFDSFFVASQYNTSGALFVAMAYFSMVVLACRRGWPMSRLAAVGRMALSNYLLQTLICTALFNGPVLGLFGQVPRVGQAGITAAIWVLQLLISPWWLARFHFGPAEWLWRSMTYGQWQRLRRSSPACPSRDPGADTPRGAT